MKDANFQFEPLSTDTLVYPLSHLQKWTVKELLGDGTSIHLRIVLLSYLGYEDAVKRVVPFAAINHLLAGIKYASNAYAAVELVEFSDSTCLQLVYGCHNTVLPGIHCGLIAVCSGLKTACVPLPNCLHRAMIDVHTRKMEAIYYRIVRILGAPLPPVCFFAKWIVAPARFAATLHCFREVRPDLVMACQDLMQGRCEGNSRWGAECAAASGGVLLRRLRGSCKALRFVRR